MARCTGYTILLIMFVSDMDHVDGFLRLLLQFSSPIKLTAMI